MPEQAEPMTKKARIRTLADGNEIPRLGLGVWQVPDGPECVNAVRWALELGYRHIDTAQAYGNEESVGRGIQESGIPREEIFITTKFYPGARDPEREAQGSLERLGVDQVDLYIIHWPKGGPTWAWPGMEAARDQGYTRSIGVSNFSAEELERVMEIATSPPVVDQVQLSPIEYRRKLLEACEARDVAVEAYSPLGTGQHLSSPEVTRVAARVGRTPAQVLLRWGIERAEIFDFTLSAEDLEILDALDRTGGTDKARERKWWD